jgi:hypothetical protein
MLVLTIFKICLFSAISWPLADLSKANTLAFISFLREVYSTHIFIYPGYKWLDSLYHSWWVATFMGERAVGGARCRAICDRVARRYRDALRNLIFVVRFGKLLIYWGVSTVKSIYSFVCIDQVHLNLILLVLSIFRNFFR